MTNIEPTPGSLVQVMSPPCATKTVRAIERPNPDPPISRERALSTRKNRSNTRGNASAGIPIPVSTTSMRALAPDCRVEVEIVDKRETKKADRGIVTYRHRVLNQRDEVVLELKIQRMIRRKAGAS